MDTPSPDPAESGRLAYDASLDDPGALTYLSRQQSDGHIAEWDRGVCADEPELSPTAPVCGQRLRESRGRDRSISGVKTLGPADIRRSLPMDKAVEAMRTAFASHAAGRIQSPPRSVLHTGGKRGATLVMPASLEFGDPALAVVKVVSVFPDNKPQGFRSIHGTLLAIDASTGVPLALLDGAALTAIRTAAACGLATDLLARRDSRVLAVFGSGVHARTQVRAMRAVRPIEDVRIFNPNLRSAQSMATELSSDPIPGGYRSVGSAHEALDGADIACAATTSPVPVFQDAEVPAGIHINAIGSFHAGDREVPGATVARARLVVDDIESALEEAGDVLMPMAEGLFGEDHIHCDLGSLVRGLASGRALDTELTFFKSVGIAAQDVVATQAVLREAARLGLGERIDW